MWPWLTESVISRRFDFCVRGLQCSKWLNLRFSFFYTKAHFNILFTHIQSLFIQMCLKCHLLWHYKRPLLAGFYTIVETIMIFVIILHRQQPFCQHIPKLYRVSLESAWLRYADELQCIMARSTEIAHGDQECMHPLLVICKSEITWYVSSTPTASKCCQSYRACARRQFLYDYHGYGLQCLSYYKISDDNTRALLQRWHNDKGWRWGGCRPVCFGRGW